MIKKPFKNPLVIKILDYYKNLWAISYTSAVVHWDLETYMPPFGASLRGEALGRLSVIRQKMFLESGFVKLIHKAEKEKDLNDYEKGVVRVLVKALLFYEKLPSDFLEYFEKLTNTATVVWRKAKQENDFGLFEKDLTKIFDANRKMAEYLGYKNSPYDALLDLFEEGLTTRKVSDFFDQISDPLWDLLLKIKNSSRFTRLHRLEKMKYDKNELKKLSSKVLSDLWPQFGQNFRLDVSSHPFTTSFSKFDTRITTWYHDNDFARSLLATIHEFGHALYDLQSADELEMTPIAGGSSLVIHESQSRFWENHIGRSMKFIKKYIDDFRNVTNDQKLTIDDVYSYFNQVKPSLLRVEADEVTYHFHIMLRFEIEKEIIEGKIKVSDLPEIWSDRMQKYLGLRPKNHSQGVLQDIHWSGGSVGYFPTYSLGTFLASQWREKITDDKLQTANQTQVKKWLKDNIHQYGSTFTLEDLLAKNKMVFDPKVNLDYLMQKYSEIY